MVQTHLLMEKIEFTPIKIQMTFFNFFKEIQLQAKLPKPIFLSKIYQLYLDSTYSNL